MLTCNTIEINPQQYIAKNYQVEFDWSAASFWFEIASLSEKCKIKLKGLYKNSIQGDNQVIAIFGKLGVKSEFKNQDLILTKKEIRQISNEINLVNTPDLYQPLKCTLFAKGKSTKFSGTQTLKNKETDRVTAVEKELKKLNTTKVIETYKDHRMAMSFAPLCLKYGALQVNNVEVVSKSYPNFWEDLEKGGFTIETSIH